MSISCGVSEPKPTCGVIRSPPIRGQNVQLSCVMTFRRLTEFRWSIPEAYVTASISLESAAGISRGRSSRTTVTNRHGRSIGENLRIDVMMSASGAEIPTYNCTTSFRFNDNHHSVYTLALNNINWTCVTAPVITWCMYFSHYDKLFYKWPHSCITYFICYRKYSLSSCLMCTSVIEID